MIDLLPAADVFESLSEFKRRYGRAKATILDPWYNKGVGGVRPDYYDYITRILFEACAISDHVYLWGFPEILAGFTSRIPESHMLEAWLTWFYKNNPSVIRGWRSAQNCCLHLRTPDAVMYPEHFLNAVQLQKMNEGNLRYMPGPTSVIEAPLNIGFIGRKEQTGHPAQKPMVVMERLIRMSTKPGDLVFDPMCGSGTTGIVCRATGRRSVLSDISAEYMDICQKRISDNSHDLLLHEILNKV